MIYKTLLFRWFNTLGLFGGEYALTKTLEQQGVEDVGV